MVQGYDDRLRQFIANDPLLGSRHAIDYDEFNAIWGATGGFFAVIYPARQEAMLRQPLVAADGG